LAYTAEELGRLSGVLPELLEKERALRLEAATVGIVYVIPPFGGLRTERDQAQLLQWRADSVANARRDGFTTSDGRFLPPGEAAATAASYPVAPIDQTFHAQGAAFDIRITAHNEAHDDSAYRRVAHIGRGLGLRPGYFFSKSDPFHFELPIPHEEAVSRFRDFLARGSVQVAGLVAAGILVAWLAMGARLPVGSLSL
jgi:hypothetical protein